MLERLREKLRLIQYYSANRSDSAAERAAVAGMVMATVLAFPLTALLHMSVVRDDDPLVITGILWPQDDGSTFATVEDPGALGRNEFAVSVFEMTAKRSAVGWPRATGTVHADVRLQIRAAGVPVLRNRTSLPADDPVRIAISAALIAAGHRDVARSWTVPDHRSIHFSGWIVDSILAWLALLLVLVSVLRMGVLVSAIVAGQMRASRRARSRAGCCAECGYDLSGSLYAGRCPECGALLD